ncbi:MAG: 1-deoxy-D-xylulose-5-phosphate reductoisomerase [Actinomycetia bacterium]|nr:1-deoxy-D-xylulose-5-phosphate reductoisomerase [Actinomycetes bacterium]
MGSDLPLRVAVLGATGSVGQQALDVARQHRDRVQVIALASHRNCGLLFDAAKELKADYLAVGDATVQLDGLKPPAGVELAFGEAAVVALCLLPQVDMVLNALVGEAGLRASYATLSAGKRLALANKESLVVGGDLLMPLARPGAMLPVDSEHSAIFQCLTGEDGIKPARIWLTASGGPFRSRSRPELVGVSLADTLAHPNWKMGPKITVDSATMMNKGLEVIEAMHLFALPLEKIRVVVHPQSIIHSMVEFADGSCKAQLGPTDMRLPIQYAFSYPDRWSASVEPLDFCVLSGLSFEAPDPQAFGCLRLALDAARAGGTAPCVLNAANEVAVAAFLEGSVGFLDIERCVESVLASLGVERVTSLDQLENLDRQARVAAAEYLSKSGR